MQSRRMAVSTTVTEAAGPADSTRGLDGAKNFHAMTFRPPSVHRTGPVLPLWSVVSCCEHRATTGSPRAGGSTCLATWTGTGTGDGLGTCVLDDEVAQLLSRRAAPTPQAHFILANRPACPFNGTRPHCVTSGQPPPLRSSRSTAEAISSRDRSYRP